ncbi:GTP cyclohydrolase FolE2 [Mucisphaera calidilacus]|uniref:GTP cyclohydrolase FolE2 n=1 Tax=Mucisphaera calidilacus TaxID=2527982 RepID=A0A518BXL3_9BACT|nr:GTP cyclohydrolase FolE2 [Mucisphaera calidilacus]
MTDTYPTNGSHAMPDVQGSRDERNIAINRVGVKGVRYPITLLDRKSGGEQHTVAMVDMYVALPADQKGTHMSRFLEVLNAHHRSIHSDDVMAMCREMKQRLDAEEAHLQVTFPYFIDKPAPVSGQVGKIDVEVTFTCTTTGNTDDFILGVKVPATSLCPCSKEISAYGAHNQRCEMMVEVRVAEDAVMWVEDLVKVAENAASTQVFSVLKRPDEKYVTEAAYDNPKFVEDIVRDLALALESDDRVTWYRVDSENYESIHNHNAFACIERDKQ